ncbi:MAG: type II secretion system protein [Synergistaceae bacterium]|nr:type II secretion system protein [Synergistaceae bacterium]
MKIARKGFTLLELLVVIAVMGVLGAMGMISGQEAMDVANATTIVSGFESVSAAMMMYYSEVSTSADIGAEEITEDTIVEGVQAYIKNENSVSKTAGAGVYSISIVGDSAPKSWWLTYTLTGDDTRIGKILKTKNTRLGLKSSAAANATVYDGKKTVCMKVR